MNNLNFIANLPRPFMHRHLKPGIHDQDVYDAWAQFFASFKMHADPSHHAKQQYLDRVITPAIHHENKFPAHPGALSPVVQLLSNVSDEMNTNNHFFSEQLLQENALPNHAVNRFDAVI